MTDHREIEVKFFVADGGVVRERIRRLGAVLRQPRTFEFNARYDNQDERLLKSRCLLRLRKDASVTLTFKAPPSAEMSDVKIYREREVRVNDFDTMDAILAALGYNRVQVYEKYRETWQVGEVLLCLDAMPFGLFLEIEGNRLGIKKLAGDLEFAWKNRILPSYLQIFEVLKQGERFDFTDVTFANFTNRSVPLQAYLQRLEAGVAAD